MSDYEKLGAFYLGRPLDPESGETREEPLLYDAKDLTTHALCVGMTGSGKTGLGVTLLEEAAIDGVPIIAIDPKGDLGNLLLTFPKLRPEDFRPWIDEGEAARAGRSPDEHARFTAELWRKGLGEWDQKPARIRRYADSVERAIYTPGSHAGRPISVLRSFAAPPPALADDGDALRERVGSAVSGLLGLLGIEADPIRSREHILLANLLDHAWRAGRDLDLPTLIRQIQKPPIERVGVMDLESFYPAKQRAELAMTLNNVLASPGFAAWSEGEPLDVGRLLHTADGRPRLSVISIAHLSESERMFLVTLLLTEVIAWMRAQPGSRSLRALLYMDEVFGYFPPTANPPSKTPMLTLLKQARAYGLGVVLATQNPVDLDYKGLSNCGTWFLGRLQTERDKARVIEGLESTASAGQGGLERSKLEAILTGLESRRFLMNNVHEDEPVLFQTRWALSYLAGPLTRKQIKKLEKAPPAKTEAALPAAMAAPAEPRPSAPVERPVLPGRVTERFWPATRRPAEGESLVYRPALLGALSLHYVRASFDVDEWRSRAFLAPIEAGAAASPWKGAQDLGRAAPELDAEPEARARFAELPAAAARATTYTRWKKMLVTHAYRSQPLTLWRCTKPKLVSLPSEVEGDFRARLRAALREARDLQIEKLRKRYAPKLVRLRDQIGTAERRVDAEQEQYRDRKLQSVISIGATVVGALFGRKLGSVGNVGRATTAARGMGRAARERGDISRAQDKLETLRERLAELEASFEEDLASHQAEIPLAELPVKSADLAPRKSDIGVEQLALVWLPFRVGRDGIAEPAFETPTGS